MKHTILLLAFLAATMCASVRVSAQSEPHFIAGAYSVQDGLSTTHFEIAATSEEWQQMKSTLLNCGPNVQVIGTKTESGYQIELRIEEQTGPEYVAKLMMVVGFQYYYLGDQRKEIALLASDLLPS